jgi:hypothetical protein
VPDQRGIKLEEQFNLVSFNNRLGIKTKLNFQSPVRGEKAKGETTLAKEHMPEMHP